MDVKTSHEDKTEDEREEHQHLDVVVIGSEEEFWLQEKWMEGPKVYIEVVECKEEFQIKRN